MQNENKLIKRKGKAAAKSGRPRAAAIALVVMALCLFASGGSKLAALRSRAENTFYNGVAGDGLSIHKDLQTRLESAYNIGLVAQRNGVETAALLDAYEGLRTGMDDRRAPQSSLAALNRDLTVAVEALYQTMTAYGLSESDGSLVTRQYRNFLSANDTISHDGYNREAAAFNEELSGFPAAFIAGLTGVQPLDLFR